MAFLGIEIGGTKAQVAVVSADGEPSAVSGAAVDRAAGADAVRDVIGRLVERTLATAGEPPRAVGIGFGGPVDRGRGTVAACRQVAGWEGFPLVSWITGRTGLPARLENDSNAAALAEAMLGAGRGCVNVLYSNVGSGVGAGFVVNGRIYHGRTPGELELGHLRLSLDGGTVEESASGWSIDRAVRAAVGSAPAGLLAAVSASEVPTARHLAPAIAAGDADAAAILDRAARSYAFGLSHAVHLLNPNVIVLGGGVAEIGEVWRAAVERHLDGFLMEALRPPPPVRLAALGHLVVPVGAALVARAEIAPSGMR